MTVIQILCVVIVLLYVGLRLRGDAHPARVLLRLGLLAVASWIAEDTAIHLYGFYRYSPAWWLFLDRVPLLIAVIWPVVIDSSWRMAQHLLGPRHPRLALAVAGFVLADASLIEPVAVQARMWAWHEPGLFGVPPVGILGWAFFTLACVAWVGRDATDGRPGWRALAMPLVAPLVTHALLLTSWWVLLRWIKGAVPTWPAVALAWALSVALARRSWRDGLRRRLPLGVMLVRVPPALFFFVLLAVYGHGVPALVAWTLAFAPPYLSLVDPGTR